MTTVNPDDLDELERVALGVLGVGLVPSAVAGDASFALDVVTAITLALRRGLPRETYLGPDGRASAEFQRRLSDTYYDLDIRRILGVGGPPPDVLLRPGEATERRLDRTPLINFAQPPTVFDRYLAGRCLDELLRHPRVYDYLMGRYADSSEIWQRVYRHDT